MLIALGAEDRAELRRLLLTDFDSIVAMFTRIKSERAEATMAEDKAMITDW